MKSNEEIIDQIRKDGDPERKLLLDLWERNAGMIRKACGKFAGRLEPEDAEQECYFAFDEAVKGYDPEAGATFASYLYSRCVWHLSRYYDNTGGTIRLPVHRRQMIRDYNRMIQQWYQLKGRQPDNLTMCACLGLTPAELEQLREDLRAVQLYSLDEPLDDPDGETIGDMLPDKSEGLETAVFYQERKRALWKAVNGLKPAEGEAIRLYYQNGLTFQQAADISGKTPARIRASVNNGLRRLRTESRFRELRNFADMSPVYSKAIQGTGSGNFNKTWTSATEKTALWILEAEERFRQACEDIDRMLERNRREREDYERRKAGG